MPIILLPPRLWFSALAVHWASFKTIPKPSAPRTALETEPLDQVAPLCTQMHLGSDGISPGCRRPLSAAEVAVRSAGPILLHLERPSAPRLNKVSSFPVQYSAVRQALKSKVCEEGMEERVGGFWRRKPIATHTSHQGEGEVSWELEEALVSC